MEICNKVLQDLPEPVAQALEQRVHALWEHIKATQNGLKHPVSLPVWPGKPIGALSRVDIYDEVI